MPKYKITSKDIWKFGWKAFVQEINKLESIFEQSKKIILDCSLENGGIVAAKPSNSSELYHLMIILFTLLSSKDFNIYKPDGKSLTFKT